MFTILRASDGAPLQRARDVYLPAARRHSASGLTLIAAVGKACPGAKFEPSPFDP